jgi:hypothetical protein
MVGSEKQVAWALKIQGDFVKFMPNRLSLMGASDIERVNAAVAKVAAVDSAKFWIDNRELLGGNFKTSGDRSVPAQTRLANGIIEACEKALSTVK